ncbi:hypothetical protein [Desulfosporosinus metallidurans]|uniref:Transporter n=1 Tax=Desulfosporosinus metallidurans TaxID=1888891 RepID=A0A1Q8QS91_9FIRM|nr:hypothetical protein [Desulfosporosinus metallidurans]OLN30223.1 Transporter [Desulfosporosinus metallidurans]
MFSGGLKDGSTGLRLKKLSSFYYLVLILGFVLSVLWVLLVRTEPVSDFEYYQRIATQIANGGQWGDTYTTVGYPIFLAPFYWLLGASTWVAKALNLVLSTLNNVLVLHILGKIGIAERLRKRIFVLFVLFPMNIYYNSNVASEILFTTLLLLGTYVYLSDIKYKYVSIGVITGLNTMLKPYFPLFALTIILTDLVWHKEFLKSFKNGVVVILLAGVVLAPWLYRNYKLTGEFTYVSNNGGIVLYINNNSQNKLSGWMPAENVENSVVNRSDYRSANPTEKNKMLSRAAKAWIVGHPREFVSLGLKRVKRTFIQYGDKNYGDIFLAFYGSGISPSLQIKWFKATELIRASVFIGGIASILSYTIMHFGLFFARENYQHREKTWYISSHSRDKGCLFLLITFYMFAGVYFLTEGQSRYAFPTVLSLTLYVVLGIEGIWSSIERILIKLRG